MLVKDSFTSLREDMYKVWRLYSIKGRQVWKIRDEMSASIKSDPLFQQNLDEAFRFDRSKNSNSSDLVYRKIAVPDYDEVIEIPEWLNGSTNFISSLEKKSTQTAYKGITFYQKLQAEDGHWPGDYGGPLFLLPGLIFASYITRSPFSTEKQILMKRYMLNHQNEDGGWGLHIEGASTMFGTVMQYCALRLLGTTAETTGLSKAREWIISHGGAVGVPSWGKFFLSLLGVYEWKGCNSLMPEMWLLPKWLPIHPWRYWCHARMVYLPMSYCYGNRIKAEEDSLIEALRSEIYPEDYQEIDWGKQRNKVADTDSFFSSSPLLKGLFSFINLYEHFPSTYLRKRSLKFVLEYVEAEDKQTKSIDIGPVNQIINSICIGHAYGHDSKQFKEHFNRWDDYLWLAEDGLKMNGYNGSQLWDTAFATQALLENQAELVDHRSIAKAYQYINESQIKEEVPHREKFFRHPSVGGWPFSTLDHGWPISDCTAEGLKAALGIHQSEFRNDIKSEEISTDRMKQAVDLILSFQNKDGGWATYENTRSSPAIEFLNPSEVFGNIMIDYSWVECSSACLTALMAYHQVDRGYRPDTILKAIDRGIRFLLKQQREDGSWIGSWGVCFTYGTWFGIEALTSYKQLATGSIKVDPKLTKACEFLAGYQNDDGGWGESYLSCVQSQYVPHSSQVVNTGWALLGLMAARYHDKDTIDRGVDFLCQSQMDNGDWPQQGISGVFNQNCMITYTAYRNVFPIWALGRYLKNYGKTLNYR